jgi:hypothetical protein
MRKTLVILVLCLFVSAGLVPAQEKAQGPAQDKELFDAAKKAIYQKDWKAALEALEKIEREFPKSAYLGESLYWSGYSLNKAAAALANLETQLEAKKEALGKLETKPRSSGLKSPKTLSATALIPTAVTSAAESWEESKAASRAECSVGSKPMPWPRPRRASKELPPPWPPSPRFPPSLLSAVSRRISTPTPSSSSSP